MVKKLKAVEGVETEEAKKKKAGKKEGGFFNKF